MTHIRFWWDNYSPEEIFEDFARASSADFEVSTDGLSWRPPKPGATISSVADWMTEQDKAIAEVQFVRTRRVPPRFLYIVALSDL